MKRLLIANIFLLIAIFVLVSLTENLQTIRNDVNITVDFATPMSIDLNVAVIGDIHASENPGSFADLRVLIEEVTASDPDLVVFVGDYTEHPSAVREMMLHRQNIIEALVPAASVPSVFVLGNYETWSDADLWYSTMSRHGLNVLENEVKIFDTRKGSFCVRGFGDHYSGRFQYIDFPEICNEAIRLSVTHDPFGAFHDRVEGLVLAGHTHCGQVNLPFLGILWVPSDVPDESVCGVYEDDRRTVFVTSGIGTSILPIRFGAQSQWDFITLRVRR